MLRLCRTFSMTYYDLSRTINDEKVKHAVETGADVLVTGCLLAGCIWKMGLDSKKQI